MPSANIYGEQMKNYPLLIFAAGLAVAVLANIFVPNIRNAFWAGIVLMLIGLVGFLLTRRRRAKPKAEAKSAEEKIEEPIAEEEPEEKAGEEAEEGEAEEEE